MATKEGGAITGEERLREHTDTLYGAIMSYEGRPATYQVARIAVLQRELDDVAAAFGQLTDKELPGLNAQLKGKGLPELALPKGAAADAGPQLSSGQVEQAFTRFLVR